MKIGRTIIWGLIVLLMVCVLPVAALDWTWSTDGWDGWSHTASWSGTEIGDNSEYGPFILDGYGVHGTSTHLVAGEGSASVERTFIDPTGIGWNSLIFNGILSSSDVPSGRWMKIHVNGQEVFSGNALSYPPGNGQVFEIHCSFPQSSSVTINISSGQDPLWGVNYFVYYDSLKFIHPSSLEVKSSPSHAKIYINGIDTMQLTKWTFNELVPGEYDVTVNLEGYTNPATETVTVVSGKTASVHFKLDKIKKVK
jgi:hypothetical protein